MNERLRGWLPLPLMALSGYIGLVSLSVIAGLSTGLEATSRMDLYRALDPDGLGRAAHTADPAARWLIGPVFYHVETIVIKSAWFAYSNAAFVEANQSLINGFFQYVVPVAMFVLVWLSFYLLFESLGATESGVARLLLRLLGWSR